MLVLLDYPRPCGFSEESFSLWLCVYGYVLFWYHVLLRIQSWWFMNWIAVNNTGTTVKSNWTQKPKASEGAFKNVQKRVYSYGTWIRFGCQRSVTAGGKVLFDCCPIVNEHISTARGKQGLLEWRLHSLMWEFLLCVQLVKQQAQNQDTLSEQSTRGLKEKKKEHL